MILLQNERVGCEHCIRGHRAADCIHLGKQLISIKGRGRPAAKDESIRLKVEPNPVIGFTSYELIESKNGKGQSKTRKLCYHLHPETPVSLFKVRLGKGFKVIGPVTNQSTEASLKVHKNQTLNLVSPEQQVSMAKLSYAKGDNSIGLASVFEQRLPVTITEDEYPSVLKTSQALFHQYCRSKATDDRYPSKKKPKTSEANGYSSTSTDSTPIFTPASDQTIDGSISPNGALINKNIIGSGSRSGSGSRFNSQRVQYYDRIVCQSNLQKIGDVNGGVINLSYEGNNEVYPQHRNDEKSDMNSSRGSNHSEEIKPQQNSRSLIGDEDLNRLIAEVDSFLPSVDLDFSTDSQWYLDNVQSHNFDQPCGFELSQECNIMTGIPSSLNASFLEPSSSQTPSSDSFDTNLQKEFAPKISNAILGLYADDTKFSESQTFEDEVTLDLAGPFPITFTSKKIAVDSSEFSSH